MIPARLLSFFHYVTGLMDALIGAGLVVCPTLILRLMGVSAPGETVFVSYLGVFVFAVGASHFLVGRFPVDDSARERWTTTWRISALARFCVALFVLIQIVRGTLEVPWLTVAATDFFVAVILTLFLRFFRDDFLFTA